MVVFLCVSCITNTYDFIIIDILIKTKKSKNNIKTIYLYYIIILIYRNFAEIWEILYNIQKKKS